MPTCKDLPPLSKLYEVLELCNETGVLYFKSRKGDNWFNARYAGKVAGGICQSKGYVLVGIDGARYSAHRIIWAMYNGKLPPKHLEIDHINRVRDDNRPANLRLVTPSANQRNTLSRTGLPKGVCVHKTTGKYQASIRLHLGTFSTAEEADAAYKRAENAILSHLY